MPNILNGFVPPPVHEEILHEQPHTLQKPPTSTDDWSNVTKELLDSLPQTWTRGLLYFLVIFISIALPWAMFSQVDETGTARGRLEPEGKTVRLDAAVAGTVEKILVKEGESVKAGQTLLSLESELVNTELRQAQTKLEAQLNQLSQLNLLKNQLVLAWTIQRQQNQAQELEKQAQIDQEKQNLKTIINSNNFQEEEKLAQVNQARKALEHSRISHNLVEISLNSAQREVERYKQAWQEGIVPEINLVDKQDIAKERKKLLEQTKSDIEQSKLRLAEQQNSYERTIRQAKANIEQSQLRIQEKERSYQSLNHAGKLAVLRSEEQLKNLDREITLLKAEISQNKSQIAALKFQLSQRELKAPVDGTVFQLPIQRAGSVVQPGAMIAEIAPINSPLVIKAQMATTESGSLKTGLPVKLKFDAYPFQDYGVIEGKLLEMSPTTFEVDTPNGRVAAYQLDIALNQHCMPTANQCIPLRPGDTATAEVVVRQRRIIDFLLDPFKKLKTGGLEL
ncbi:multidrug resistance efflux pump [Nostoc sp. PCC 7524]|uniref:HlyD family efflux transporter periplasmic adaptor subunit n=1 Tax=Nostoc sp. (strain ATCC 29411 / PCC 7524) TaxID=28072 RepID=UPI00029F4CEF|nr:HlyD family efflux transporter periplasmic adaptor subunit [Nostoc sp. PCC 7524]AFY48961.1 multidrug resistance efflux pump [Nostoc sp. PCC 7524]